MADQVNIAQNGLNTDCYPDDANHAHTADNVEVTQIHTVFIDGSVHLHTADDVGIIQWHNILIDSCAHAHTADEVFAYDNASTIGDITNPSITSLTPVRTINSLTIERTINDI